MDSQDCTNYASKNEITHKSFTECLLFGLIINKKSTVNLQSRHSF